MSSVSSILGYVPSKEQPQALPLRPTQAEMQELYAALSLDPHNLPDGREPSRKLEVITDVKVSLFTAMQLITASPMVADLVIIWKSMYC